CGSPPPLGGRFQLPCPLVGSGPVLRVLALPRSRQPSPAPSGVPDRAGRFRVNADRSTEADARTVRIYDSCDPATFNAVFNDPTICLKQGHVPFDRFIAELTHTQQAAQWRFGPKNVELDRGENLFAVNQGGEVHTFTRVARFGGG